MNKIKQREECYSFEADKSVHYKGHSILWHFFFFLSLFLCGEVLMTRKKTTNEKRLITNWANERDTVEKKTVRQVDKNDRKRRGNRIERLRKQSDAECVSKPQKIHTRILDQRRLVWKKKECINTHT